MMTVSLLASLLTLSPEVPRTTADVRPSWISVPDRPLVSPPDPSGAFGYEPTPAVVYLATDGIDVDASCGAVSDTTHSAVACSSLLDQDVTVTPWPSADEANELFTGIRQRFEPFNIVFTTSRPPSWVPYTLMAAGEDSVEVAGISNICAFSDPICDGVKRNGVGFVFPCSQVAPVYGAQMVAQVFGLETVDAPGDLMNAQGVSSTATFTDSCETLYDNFGGGDNDCPAAHGVHCGDGMQNSYRELLGLFGPREVDEEPPAILSMTPEDGANVEAGEVVLVTADIEENSNFVAVRWTFSGGGESVDGCTNGTCDVDFGVPLGTAASRMQWDFLELEGAPLGEYTVTLDVTDAYGNTQSRMSTFNVVEPGSVGGSSSGDGGESSGGPPESTGDTSEPPMTTTDGPPSAETGTSGAPEDSGEAQDDQDGEGGCSCRAGDGSGSAGFALLLAVGMFGRRRRRSVACGSGGNARDGA